MSCAKTKSPQAKDSGMRASKLNLQEEKLDSIAPLARAVRLTTTVAAAGTATPCLARVKHSSQ
jgi:hypothetical protein